MEEELAGCVAENPLKCPMASKCALLGCDHVQKIAMRVLRQQFDKTRCERPMCCYPSCRCKVPMNG